MKRLSEMTPDKDISALCGLCDDEFGRIPVSCERLRGGGGDRKYYRFTFESPVDSTGKSLLETVIGVKADNTGDARAFVGLTGVFARYGVSVPRVYAHNNDYTYYLVQDLGDRSLFDSLHDEGIDENLREVMVNLVRMQTVPVEEWKDRVNYKPFSFRQAMWDLNYFKYEYLKAVAIDFDEDKLEDDFQNFAGRLIDTDRRLWGFMMRDCQSRNVMLAPDPVFIDYQGGRLGPCLYDAISFLWQAKAGFSSELRSRLFEVYADAFASATGMEACIIKENAGQFALFRTLQVLGAYGFRGLVQKRAHFIESIPGALRNLEMLLADGVADAYPELRRVAVLLTGDNRFNKVCDGRLHVKVFSFSYKKGYPADYSGNGGGFMFDCRGMHNPGRYKEFKALTGKDKQVADFLILRGEADPFVKNALEMVSPSVECYCKRGFDSLQIGFGCTGGQHRSVYCAENFARLLAEKYPDVAVDLFHREQNIKSSFNNISD